jgi:hypothetical protein
MPAIHNLHRRSILPQPMCRHKRPVALPIRWGESSSVAAYAEPPQQRFTKLVSAASILREEVKEGIRCRRRQLSKSTVKNLYTHSPAGRSMLFAICARTAMTVPREKKMLNGPAAVGGHHRSPRAPRGPFRSHYYHVARSVLPFAARPWGCQLTALPSSVVPTFHLLCAAMFPGGPTRDHDHIYAADDAAVHRYRCYPYTRSERVSSISPISTPTPTPTHPPTSTPEHCGYLVNVPPFLNFVLSERLCHACSFVA